MRKSSAVKWGKREEQRDSPRRDIEATLIAPLVPFLDLGSIRRDGVRRASVGAELENFSDVGLEVYRVVNVAESREIDRMSSREACARVLRVVHVELAMRWRKGEREEKRARSEDSKFHFVSQNALVLRLKVIECTEHELLEQKE
jgi:hypothetical protein